MERMEFWREIPGYEGLYWASNKGRIRSRRCVLSPYYRQRKCGNNYDALVNLCKDGKPHTQLVARLVAMVWNTGYRPGLTVNHLNGNSLDNRPENMEWVSKAENLRYGHECRQFDKHHRPCVLIDSSGLYYEFEMQKDAERFLGRGRCYIANAKKHGCAIYSSSGEPYTLIQ